MAEPEDPLGGAQNVQGAAAECVLNGGFFIAWSSFDSMASYSHPASRTGRGHSLSAFATSSAMSGKSLPTTDDTVIWSP